MVRAGLIVCLLPRLSGQSVPPETIVMQRSQHLRLSMPTDIARVAVGDPELLSAEPIGSRELLVLGKGWGRTSLIVWFRDKTIREYTITVHRDITILQNALRNVHPNIRVEIAPDRDAVLLVGTVPDISVSRTAEAIAKSYLDASANNRNNSGEILVYGAQSASVPPAPGDPQAPVAPATRELFRVPVAAARPSNAVLNLLRLENLPPLIEEKLAGPIQAIGGKDVRLRRVVKGVVRDDIRDVFVLEGSVPNQVALVRILSLVAQALTGQSANVDDIRVLADESGALALTQQTQQQNTQFGNAGGAQLFGGSSGNSRLNNQIRRNLGRAKVIELAGGRILSFLQVKDLPQVRVSIRLYEVNRNQLKTFSPNLGVLTSSANQVGLQAPAAAQTFQGTGAAGTGGGGKNAVQNVLSFLNGTLASQTQLSTAHFAIDAALSYLERVGVARSLSSPSLTVLSGESAIFQVGGQIPIPESFIPAFSGNTVANGTTGVYNSVVFQEFGIKLDIRPLVDEDDAVTLDVQPQIITPNAELTASIRDSTGTNQLTTAFQTRALRTSARLRDGQALLVGGLLARDTSDTQNSTPGVRDVPGLGWLFKNFNKTDDARELIIVVNPVVVREPNPNTNLWAYPESRESLPSK